MIYDGMDIDLVEVGKEEIEECYFELLGWADVYGEVMGDTNPPKVLLCCPELIVEDDSLVSTYPTKKAYTKELSNFRKLGATIFLTYDYAANKWSLIAPAEKRIVLTQ